jgi:hypothetical protein
VVVREESLAVRDDSSVPLDASSVVLVAKMQFATEHSAEIARTPPLNRQAINKPRW